VAQVTDEDIEGYKLKGKKGWCRVYVRRASQTLRSFFRYAEDCVRGVCWIASTSMVRMIQERRDFPPSQIWDDVQRPHHIPAHDPRTYADSAISDVLATRVGSGERA